MAVIQIRGVDNDAHGRLKARAARRGQSLTEYLRGEIELLAQMPTLEEINERVATQPRPTPSNPAQPRPTPPNPGQRRVRGGDHRRRAKDRERRPG